MNAADLLGPTTRRARLLGTTVGLLLVAAMYVDRYLVEPVLARLRRGAR